MVACVTAAQAEQQGRIRPFVAHRDLLALASLLEEAFGPELSATGSHIVHDLRQMATLGPLLLATRGIVNPFTGFVWVEGDPSGGPGTERLVGNVSLSRERDEPGTWCVSNVAVLPSHRGRGIAGRLMDHAIAHAARQGARRLVLQVRTDNPSAQALYRHRGFRVVDTLHEMQIYHHDLPIYVGDAAPRQVYGVRAAAAADREGIRRLLLANPAATFQNPSLRARIEERSFWGSLRRHLLLALAGERWFEVVARPSGAVVAYAYACTNSVRGPHELGLYAAPEARGRWEVPLLDWLLYRLRAAVPQNVRALLSAHNPAAVRAAEDAGFRTLRILDQMVLEWEGSSSTPPSHSSREQARGPLRDGRDEYRS